MTEIDLKNIVSNNDNSREPAPVLQGYGYGVVEPVGGVGKPSLFALALGNPEDQARYCKLVEQYEEPLVALAESIDQQGQLQNCRVRPISEGKHALTFGARRCLAVLYLHAKHGKKAKVAATVSESDGKEALIESAAENVHLPPSYIDQARLFKRLCDQGLTVKEIAKVCPMGKATEQNIRHRLRLLELLPEVQIKVHHGKLSQDAALKLLKNLNGEEAPQQPPVAEPQGSKPHSEEEPLPTKKEPQADGESVSDEEAPAGTEAELRAILQSFIDKLNAFDLDGFSAQDPKELLRVTRKATRILSKVKAKAKGPKEKLALVG